MLKLVSDKERNVRRNLWNVVRDGLIMQFVGCVLDIGCVVCVDDDHHHPKKRKRMGFLRSIYLLNGPFESLAKGRRMH